MNRAEKRRAMRDLRREYGKDPKPGRKPQSFYEAVTGQPIKELDAQIDAQIAAEIEAQIEAENAEDIETGKHIRRNFSIRQKTDDNIDALARHLNKTKSQIVDMAVQRLRRAIGAGI